MELFSACSIILNVKGFLVNKGNLFKLVFLHLHRGISALITICHKMFRLRKHVLSNPGSIIVVIGGNIVYQVIRLDIFGKDTQILLMLMR